MSSKQLTQMPPGRASPILPGPPDREGPSDTKHDNIQSTRLPAQRELLFLWAIEGTGRGGCYGLDLQRAVNECSGESEQVSTGTLYSTLKKLKRKGWINSYEGDALGGGAKRVYYFLTDEGIEVLERVNAFLSKLRQWQPISRA